MAWPDAFARRGTQIAVLALAFACAPVHAAERSVLLAEARALEHGEGVPKNPQAAAQLYCEAARDGDAEAQFSLGWMYANGRGVARDDVVASSMFTLAAAQGHADAARMQALITSDAIAFPDCMRPPPLVAALPMPDFDIRVDDPVADLAPWKQGIARMVTELAPQYAVDPRLALAVIAVESNFEATARSNRDARGLMQLVPATMARFNVRNGYDVKDNVRGGLAYLRFLLGYYRGNVRLAAAAYNAGERAVDRYGGVPPYAETVDYVRRVLQLFRRETHPYDADAATTSPIFAIEAPSK